MNLHARRSDPRSSQEALARYGRDEGLYRAIVEAAAYAADHGKPFTDGWLADRIGRPRNIVARVRLQAERDGWVVRLSRMARTPTGPVLLFEMPSARRALLTMVASPLPEE